MTNPLFNDNRLKLGIFGTNGTGGAQTLVPELYQPTWANSVRTAQLADRAGFEAILAYARWKAYMPGKPEHTSGIVLDPFTWCAGIAQATTYSAVMPTSHAPTIHPITCAKQTATIHIISGGRLGLNVVGGWNRHELEMFGAPMREHDDRYEQLEEWLAIIKKLWIETEEFDFAGAFYRVQRGASMPKLVQKPHPPIMKPGALLVECASPVSSPTFVASFSNPTTHRSGRARSTSTRTRRALSDARLRFGHTARRYSATRWRSRAVPQLLRCRDGGR